MASRKVFTSQKISVVCGGVEHRVQALVSPYGAKYVFEDEDLPTTVRDSIGKEIQVIYKNIPVRARLVKENTAIGVLYNIKFLNPSNLLVRQINRDINETGLPSPWLRSLPRLNTDSKHLPNPALAVLYYRGITFYLNVKNFTLGGVMLEYAGAELASVILGTKFDFDIVTNFGDKISELSAVVTHISAELSETDGDKYYFGVKFLPMTLLSETKFRALIRDHCVGLLGEIGSGEANAG